jgi:hypothetical protein
MHHHADRAMIGVRLGRMDVNHLNKGQKGQQHQTDKRRGAQSPGTSIAGSSQSLFAASFHWN